MMIYGACHQLVPRRLLQQHIFEMVCSCPEKRYEDFLRSYGRAIEVIDLDAKVDEQHRVVRPAPVRDCEDKIEFCADQEPFNVVL